MTPLVDIVMVILIFRLEAYQAALAADLEKVAFGPARSN